MIARLILGAVVIVPVFCWRPSLTLSGLVCCIALAVIIGLCVPDSWQE